MKEQFVKALTKLRNKVTWLATNNKLSDLQVKDYNFILQSFTQFYNHSQKQLTLAEEQISQYNMDLSQLLTQISKLKVIIQMTGLSERFIKNAMNMELHYLQNELAIFNKTETWIQSEAQVRVFYNNHRVYKSLIDSEKSTISDFEWLINFKKDHPHVNVNMLVDSFYSIFPHLTYYLTKIEEEGKLKPFYKPHLHNALDSLYLWKS